MTAFEFALGLVLVLVCILAACIPHKTLDAFVIESKASREVQDMLFDARAVLKARSPWRA